MRSLAFVSLAAVAAAQGYLNLDLGKRQPLQAFNDRLARRQNEGNIVNSPLYQDPDRVEYIVNITIGTPSQRLGVTLDTGSSDLWVPTPSMCRETKCDLGDFNPDDSSSLKILEEGTFNITYAGPGDSDAGDYVTDIVTIADAEGITGQVFGAALAGADQHGVMGIGFDTNEASNDLTRSGIYPSIMDNLVSQNIITRKAFSLYLNALNETVGSVILGGVDSTKYTGDLVVLPLQPSFDPEQVTEFVVTLTQVAFNDANGATTVLTPANYAQGVLLDSGTSITLLDADTASQLAIGLGAVDSGSQNYVLPCQFINTNATVSYTFGGTGGVIVTVPVSELISGQDANLCDLAIAPPLGGSVILGDSFLRSAYAVFDIDNKLAALAQAVDGQSGTSSVQAFPSGSSIPGATRTATASGTQLVSAQADATGSVPLARTSNRSIIPGTPTFALGSAATSGVVSGNAACVQTGHPQVALVGMGLAAAMLAL